MHNVPQKGHRLLVSGMGNLKVVQEIPKIIKNMAIAFGCLQEPKGKTQLLKTSCTLDTGLGRFELVVTWKPPP